MASSYQIVCVNHVSAGTHHHISSVGMPNGALPVAVFTVQQIYQFIDSGDSFYVVSPTTGKTAWVGKYPCDYCQVNTLRTHADGVWDNNLSSLGSCG